MTWAQFLDKIRQWFKPRTPTPPLSKTVSGTATSTGEASENIQTVTMRMNAGVATARTAQIMAQARGVRVTAGVGKATMKTSGGFVGSKK